MSYDQAIKHRSNHRKDRYYQQCGFSISSHEKSYAAIAEKYATGYYVGSLQTKEPISTIFQDSDSAVDFYRALSATIQNKCGIFSDKGFLIME